MKIRKFMENFLENVEDLENLPALIFHAWIAVFLGRSANTVKFQVMEIFPGKIVVLENLPTKTEIFHAKTKIFLG
jgi:hypothetical protein